MKLKSVKESKSFLIEPELLSSAKDCAKAEGISINEFIRLSIKDRVFDGRAKLEAALRSLEEVNDNLKKQAIQMQLDLAEETLSLSKSIKAANADSIERQEQMVKGVILKLANLHLGEAAPSPVPSQPKQPVRKSGPDFKVD
ncbi:hypothetical protein [Stenotrophomonas maltophilia]|uniref:hypothetical protein n=1 Tax=Stenotrophomonas maltophilia TaxID=40324 RepID=UPI0012FD6D13|nr:hypothetical protein [Stenotrophomonas maltophilia]